MGDGRGPDMTMSSFSLPSLTFGKEQLTAQRAQAVKEILHQTRTQYKPHSLVVPASEEERDSVLWEP